MFERCPNVGEYNRQPNPEVEAQQDAVLPVPVSQPTSCAFGGPGLADLFITTANTGLSETERAEQPLAGRLLRVAPGPIGLPSTMAKAALPA